MKLIVKSYNKQIKEALKYADGLIIGIKDLSVNCPEYMTIEEAIEVINKYKDKDIFISLNKNIHNDELDKLKEVMKKLNNINFKAVIFYDIAVVNIHRENNYSYDLVWAKEHATTNYFTANYWEKKGINYMEVSADITIGEIKEIRDNSKMKLLVPVFGHLPMIATPRHLVDNYKKEFNLKDKSKVNYVSKEGQVYPIIEEASGTVIYSANVLNGYEEASHLSKAGIDYGVLNSFLIPNFIEILKIFKEENKSEKIKELIKAPFDKGFMYKETVYKVK